MKNRDINTTLSLESYLGKFVKVKIDRPLASRHPEHGFVYCLNYGFIPDTVSGDGEEIDAYVVGEFEAVEAYEGYVVAVIKRKNDVEDKLVVCKEKGICCTNNIILPPFVLLCACKQDRDKTNGGIFLWFVKLLK